MASIQTGAALGVALLLSGALAATSLAGCEGRTRETSPAVASRARAPAAYDAPAVAEIDLSRGAPETVPSSLFGPARGATHSDLVRALRSTAEADTTKGVLVRLGTASFGFARAHEIGRLLAKIRAKGVPVVCQADDFANGTLLLASVGCSDLWLSPAGSVDAVGLAAQLLFGNKLLTKLHIDVDFLQVGKYKGAQEPFTRDAPSPEARESLEGALGGIRTAWLDAIVEGRAKREELRPLLEDGPYSAEEAKQKGLIDHVGYADEARDAAKKSAGVDQAITRFGAGEGQPPVSRGIVEILRALSGSGRGGTPHVAVLRASGAISMAPSGMFGQSDGITERELGKALARLTKDDSAKAVVLRIDSPGGSALASDLLWKRLMKLRAEKPLVISVGGMAASGGYYMACTGTKIVAEPTSIVGSIGVVGGKLAVGHALDEIGVHVETVGPTRDPAKLARATMMSPMTPWDDATRARTLTTMVAIYDLFLQRIAEGRGKKVDEIAPSAEGRIFGGVDAKARGLVDELGGLDEAVRIAFELAKLPADAPVVLVGETPGLLDLLDGDDSDSAKSEALRTARDTAADALLPRWIGAMPELSAFVASAAPLAEGEQTVTALPFALILR